MATSKYDGTQTASNLIRAAIWATHSISTYEIGARKAREEGNEPLYALLQETALWEKIRAETWWLERGEIELVKNRAYFVHDGMPMTFRKTAAEYRDLVIMLEGDEQAEYEGFAVTARQEGFPNLALKFQLAAAEKRYNQRRFQALPGAGNRLRKNR